MTERTPLDHPADPDELYSPPEYVDAAREVMGGIELDPASCAAANRVVRAERYYSKADEGETRNWRAESIWLNPPRREWVIDRFTWRMARGYEAGVFRQGIALVDSATESYWFQYLGASADAIIFPPDRSHFWREDENGEEMESDALGAHALIYLGGDPDRFLDVMRKRVGGFGYVANPAEDAPRRPAPPPFRKRKRKPGEPSFAEFWRGKFKLEPGESEDDDPRYQALARKYLT